MTHPEVELLESREARGRRDPGAAGAAPPGAPDRRGVVLRRPHGPGRRSPRTRPRHRPAPAHRPADGHLAARGRGPAPRQPRLGAGDPPRPAQPDDGRARRRPRRGGHRHATAASSTASSSGSPSPRRPATARRRSSTTPSCPASSSTARRPPCWSATFGRRRPRRPGATPTTSASSSTCAPGAPSVPLRADYEHALVVLDGAVRRRRPAASRRATSPTSAPGATSSPRRRRRRRGRCCSAASRSPTPILMWWNFVARTTDEIDGRPRRRGSRAPTALRRGRVVARAHPRARAVMVRSRVASRHPCAPSSTLVRVRRGRR